MASDPRPSRMRVDRDGVRLVETPRRRRDVWIVAGLGLAAVVALLGTRLGRGSSPQAPVAPAPQAAHTRPGEVPQRAATDPQGVPRPAAAAPAGTAGVAARPHPRRRERAAAPEAEPPTFEITGERTGIALFPPPGTKPIRRGIIVPEHFELPAGYVRHYQTTDDGRDVPPILMFSPDYDWVDAAGEPVTLPEDRIVPPALAPPGLPIVMLPAPEPAAADAPTP